MVPSAVASRVSRGGTRPRIGNLGASVSPGRNCSSTSRRSGHGWQSFRRARVIGRWVVVGNVVVQLVGSRLPPSVGYLYPAFFCTPFIPTPSPGKSLSPLSYSSRAVFSQYSYVIRLHARTGNGRHELGAANSPS